MTDPPKQPGKLAPDAMVQEVPPGEPMESDEVEETNQPMEEGGEINEAVVVVEDRPQGLMIDKNLEVEEEETESLEKSNNSDESEEESEEEEQDDPGRTSSQGPKDNFGNGGFSSAAPLAAKPKTRKTLKYLVCQVQEGVVIAARRSHPNSWPYFMAIEDQLVRDWRRPLRVGDLVQVIRFSWSASNRYLAATIEEEDKPTCKFWLNPATGLLPKQAYAEELAPVHLVENYRTYIGVVYYIKRKNNRDPDSFVCGELACAGLAISSKFNRRQLLNIEPTDLELGMLVEVLCAPLNDNDLVEARYVIPPGPYKFGTERLAHGRGALAMIRPNPTIFPRPNIFPFSVDYTDEQLKTAEHATAAALQFAMENDFDRMINNKFEGRAALVKGDEFTLIFPARPKKQVSEIAAVWEIENLVQATERLGVPHFAQGIVLETQPVMVDQNVEFHVTVKLTNVQKRKNRDVEAEFAAFQNGGIAVVFPIPGRGARMRLACFRDNLPSALAAENTPQGRIMAALLARPSVRGYRMQMAEVDDQNPVPAPEDEQLHPVIQALNARQKKTAKMMMARDGCLVNQQAPPGTGKTRVAAAIIRDLLDTAPEEQIAVIAISNLPVVKLVEELEQISGNNMEQTKAVVFFSGTARVKYSTQVATVEAHTMSDKSSQEPEKALSEWEQKKLDEYLDHCADNPRFCKERQMARIFQRCWKPKVVFCSASIAEDLIEGAFGNSTILIFDEATQASWSLIVHLVSRMPKLKAVLLTGDKRQLGTYLQPLPDLFQAGFGLESVIAQVDSSPGIIYTFLTLMYRSHSFIVNCLSHAAYELHGDVLIAARVSTLITQSNIPLPSQDAPIALIHAFSFHRQSPISDSLTDDHQTEVTAFLIEGLLAHGLRKEQIVVLCMYTHQMEELDRRLEATEVPVITVDAFQAQERDVVVLVTTRSREERRASDEGRKMGFFQDNERATVALSRARHGLFIIGDLIGISIGPVWRRFIERALTRTRPLNAAYTRDLLNQKIERLPSGVLVGEQGSVEHGTFATDWATYHGQSLAGQPVQFQHMPQGAEHWPAMQPAAGPSRRTDGRGRGGQLGPAGRFLRYAGNPKKQIGGRGRPDAR